MLVYESRESGREIIPGMDIWAQLGVQGGSRPPDLPSWANRPPISLRGILTYLSEDPGLTTYFFPGRDGVGGGGYPDV